MQTGELQQPISVPDYKTSTDNLCLLIGNPNVSENELTAFFEKHPMLYDVNGRDSVTNLRPVQLAARNGNYIAFRYLIEIKRADLSADRIRHEDKFIREKNLIEFACLEILDPRIQAYILATRLWRRFNDNSLLEVHGFAWGGDIERVMSDLDAIKLTAKEQDRLYYYVAELRDSTEADAPLIEHLAILKSIANESQAKLPNLEKYIDEEDDELFSDADEMRLSDLDDADESEDYEAEITPQQKIINTFCKLAADPKKTADDLAQFIQDNAANDFSVNGRDTEFKARAVDFAGETGSLSSLKFLVEVMNADIKHDENFKPDNLMYQIKNIASEKLDYFLEHRLWEKMCDGTMELHVYAWAGRADKLREILYHLPAAKSAPDQRSHDIFTKDKNDDSVITIVEIEKQHACLELLQNYTNDLYAEAIAKKLWDLRRDLCLLKGESRNITSAEAIDTYFEALYCHRHATIDYSRDTEDRIIRLLANEFRQNSDAAIKPFPAQQGSVIIGSTLESTNIAYPKNTYTLSTVSDAFVQAITFQKEALRLQRAIHTKLPTDLNSFAVFRKNIVAQYLRLATIYCVIGKHLQKNDIFSEAFRAFEHSKECLTESMLIATHAKNINYELYFSDDSPAPDEEMIRDLRIHMNVLDSTIAACHDSFWKKMETVSSSSTYSPFFTNTENNTPSLFKKRKRDAQEASMLPTNESSMKYQALRIN